MFAMLANLRPPAQVAKRLNTEES